MHPGAKVAVGAVVLLMAAMPALASDFVIDGVLTRVLILSLVACSLAFLSTYGGMVSLGQTALFGVAGFTYGNAQQESGGQLELGLPPWTAALVAVAVTLLVAAAFGAVASRTVGIYFLMLTLTYAVIGFNLFLQVPDLSGSGGITGIDPPAAFAEPLPLYYLLLGLAFLTYAGLRALSRTPFGIALQGVRDDPVRMASLGYNVPAIRTLAFVVGGLVAALGGIAFVWWNGTVAPQSVGVAATIDILVIAIIGGISRLEGAFVGAAVFVLANQYLRDIPGLSEIGLTEDRFPTVIGLIVLAIVVASPDGITGLWDRLRGRRRRDPLDDDAAGTTPTLAPQG
jgi:branched-chain amino acid transport system permease protein